MSHFLCCAIRRAPWQRASRVRLENMIALKKLAIVALSLRASNRGGCVQGTGILIHNSLVLTSHMNLPNKERAGDGEIVLTDGCLEANSCCSTAPLNERPSRVLTRKLLPSRCFLTNPSLGVTIVGCEPVSPVVPLDIESAKVPRDILNVGRSIYVLGHIEHDDKRKGLIMFGEGRVSSEDEQVIEFYSLDGNVWAPGSAGFDEHGNFAFVVGESQLPTGAKSGVSSMQKKSPSKKDPGPKQPGILVEFVGEWMRTVWDLKFDELYKTRPSAISTTLPVGNLEELDPCPSTPSETAAKIVEEVQSAGKGAKGSVVDQTPTEQFTSRVPWLGSVPVQAATASSDNSANVASSKGLSHTSGGIVDLAADELTAKGVSEPKDEPGKGLSRTTDLGNRRRLQDDFVTGFVKVKYFNKNIFSPDRMPVIDTPNQDPNGDSWFNWGKRAPASHDPGLSPKEVTADTAPCAHRVEVRLQFRDKSKDSDRISGQDTRHMPVSDASTQDLNGASWYDWGKKALQRAVPDIPKDLDLNGDSWYGWGKKAPTSDPFSPTETGQADCGLHPPKVSLPEFQSNPRDDSAKCRTADPLIIKESPRDSGLQPLRAEEAAPTPERSTSPRRELRVQHSQSGEESSDSHRGSPRISSPELCSPISRFQRPKPTLHEVDHPSRELAFGQIYRSASSPRSPNLVAAPWKGPGPFGSPVQIVKLDYAERKVMMPEASPRQRTPRFLCEMKKQSSDQKKSAEAGAARKRRERKKPGRPRWSAHSTVHKEDDSRKQATLPPRFSKPGVFPAVLYSSNGGRNDRMPAVRVISRHKERTCPGTKRVRRFFESSTSCMPSSPPASRNKIREQQLSSKQARKALSDPQASKFRPPTNVNTPDAKQITSCLQPLKETGLFVSGSPRSLAGSGKNNVSPEITSNRKQHGSDEEILKEIEILQAVLRSPRSRTVTPHEVPGRGSRRPKPTVTDGRQNVNPGEVSCSGRITIPRDQVSEIKKLKKTTASQQSERDIGFSCFRYWKKFISQRRNAAVDSVTAVFLPQPAARIDQHTRRRRSAGSSRTSSSGSSRHKDLQKAVCCGSLRPLRVGMNDKLHDGSPKHSYLYHHPHRPHCADDAPRPLRVEMDVDLHDGSPKHSYLYHHPHRPHCADDAPRPLRVELEDDLHDGSPKHSYLSPHPHRSHCAEDAASSQEALSSKVILKSPAQSPSSQKEVARDKSSSPRSRGQQQKLKQIPTVSDSTRTPCLPCASPRRNDQSVSDIQPDQSPPNTRPHSPTVANDRRPRNHITSVDRAAVSSPPPGIRPVRLSPSHDTPAAASPVDGSDTPSSPRKYKFTASGVPRKVQRLCSPGPGRPRWTGKRLDSRSASPTALVALRDGNTAIADSAGKRTISPSEVEMETMIFDTFNEDAPISKKSVAKQRASNCCLPGRERAEEPGSKANPSTADLSPRKRARLAAQNANLMSRRVMANSSRSEIGTNVVSSCSEDGSYLSEMGPIVRSEVRFATPGSTRPNSGDQHRKWVQRWRP